MKQLKKLNNDFFSLFVLGLIFLANVVSGIIYAFESDWKSVFFNAMIAGFTLVVIIHLFRNLK